MEIDCKEKACAIPGAGVNERNKCTLTWNVPKLEVHKEKEAVSGGFTDEGCVLCGEHFALWDHQAEQLVKHTDEVCCHFCQAKFSQKNLLVLHLKDAHSTYHMFCKSCNVYMGRNLTKDQTVGTLNTTVLDEKMHVVILENDEDVVGGMKETERNGITDGTEDDNAVNSHLHDHSYFSIQTCRSVREPQTNAVMYTSSENVLVFINKTDTGTSLKDSYTEHDQQRASVDDRTWCSDTHDHDYFSIQSLANPMSAHRTLHSPNNAINPRNKDIDVFNKAADPRLSSKDPECTQSDLDQICEDELVCMGLLDHTYFVRPGLSNHTVLSKRVPSPDPRRSRTRKGEMLKSQDSRNSATVTDQESASGALLGSLKIEYNIKRIQKDLIGAYEEILQGSDHDDSDTLSTDDLACAPLNELDSETDSCTSCTTDCTADPSGQSSESSESWSACQEPNCENANECRILLGIEEPLTNHQAEEQSLAKYVCVSCLRKFPTQNTFMQHVCSKSMGLTGVSSKVSSDIVHSSAAVATGSSKPGLTSRGVNIIDAAQNPGTVSNSTSHSSPSNPHTSTTQKVPVQVTATGSSRCAQEVVSGFINGNQGQEKTPVFIVPQNQIGHVQALRQSHPKMVPQTQSSCSSSTSQSLLSSQGQRQMPPISTVTQKQIGQVQVLSPLKGKVVTKTSASSSSASSSTTTTTTAQILPLTHGQGQVPSISTFIQKQIGHVLCPLQPKVVTQTPPPPVVSSSQNRGQTTRISQMKRAQVQDLTPLQTKVATHTPKSGAKVTTRAALPHQQPSSSIHSPHPFLSQVSNSGPVSPKAGHPSKSTVPFLDVCKSSSSTPTLPSSQEPLKIVAMFVNQSRELALQKRMRQSWRSKAVFPCRQCGAVSRQFSLGVRHRYQHRGPRLHRCQCGRAFRQLMHLLRHQVQHAEATRYVCAACGQMFYGTQQLACHRRLLRITATNRKKRTKKKCTNTFQCYCGRSFVRPAALLWHMLKNSKV